VRACAIIGRVARPLDRKADQIRLTARQRDLLANDGYLLLRGLLDCTVVTRIKDRLDEVVAHTVAAWDDAQATERVEAGVVHVELDPAAPLFAPCHRHPVIAQAATAMLGPDWYLCELNVRAPLPGCGHQGLHPDFEHRRVRGRWQSSSAMWCITPFTEDSGPLRIIPGSHRHEKDPTDTLAFGSGMGPHPDEVKIVTPAGSLIVFNAADLWHSGTLNYSPEARIAVTAGFRPGRDPRLTGAD
jgi:ectoine hydroxylase-related dioxygenase (phytanoyl-CoA dioxygenase family)